MNPRITALLLLIVIALGAFIYFYEVRGKEAREQAQKEAQKFFSGVKKEDITKIALTTNDGVEVTLERVEGRWQIVAPHSAPADEITVESMLSALASAAKEDILQDVQAFEVYGLDASAKEIRFTAHGVEYGLRIGREIKRGGAKYVMVDSARDVTTLPTYVLSTFDHSFDELRDKRVLYFDQAAVDQIRLRWSAGGGVLLEKQQGSWQIREPLQEMADTDTLETLLSDLYFVRAQSFVDAPSAAQTQALTAPVLQIELRTRNEAGEQNSFVLAFAASTEADARLVRRGDGVFYRVSNDVFDAIPQEVAAYRNKRLGDFDPEAVRALTITFREAGAEPVVIQGTLAAATQAARSAAGSESESDTEEFREWLTTPEAMDPQRVEDLVLELSHLRASSLAEDVRGEAALRASGLSPARVEIEIFGGDTPEARESLGHFLFGAADAEQGVVTLLPGVETVYRIPYALARVIPFSLQALQQEFTVGAEEGEADFAEPEE